MVYAGPSRGCHNCRQRRIKCDQKVPACGQCTKKKKTCPGYRSEADIIFRVENDHAASLVAARKSRRRSSPPPQAHSSARPSPGPVIQDSGELAKSTETSVISYEKLEQPPNFRTLLPTIGERASCFFITNYILQSSDISYGFMEYLPPLVGYKSGGMLSTVIECLGLAAMSNLAGSQVQATITARRRYGEALAMVNRALQTPHMITEDQTLLSVMLLGVYENITCTKLDTMNAWSSHLRGAAELVRMRGKDQFRGLAGRKMFARLRTEIVLHSSLMVTPVPSWIHEWDQYSLQFYDSSLSPAYRLLHLVANICNLRCEASTVPLEELHNFITRAILLDQEFVAWLTTLPESWRYVTYTAPPGHPRDAAYDSHYHIYYDLWTGSIWNTYRSARIMLNLVIRRWISAISKASTVSTIYVAENANCTATLNHLSIKICESISFHLGTYPGCRDVPRAIGGYFVLWPLWAACNRADADSILRNWVIERLDYIGHCMGIRQACSIAQRLRAI